MREEPEAPEECRAEKVDRMWPGLGKRDRGSERGDHWIARYRGCRLTVDRKRDIEGFL